MLPGPPASPRSGVASSRGASPRSALAMSRTGRSDRAAGGSKRAVTVTNVLKFFTNPRTAKLLDRQASLLRRLLKKNPEGYRMCDLGDLSDLLPLVLQRVEENEEPFRDLLCQLVEHACKPFIKERSNDAIRYYDHLAKLLLTVAQLLRHDDTRLQTVVTKTLHSFAHGRSSLGLDVDEGNQRLLEASKVVPELVKVLSCELAAMDADGDGAISKDEFEAVAAKEEREAEEEEAAKEEREIADDAAAEAAAEAAGAAEAAAAAPADGLSDTAASASAIAVGLLDDVVVGSERLSEHGDDAAAAAAAAAAAMDGEGDDDDDDDDDASSIPSSLGSPPREPEEIDDGFDDATRAAVSKLMSAATAEDAGALAPAPTASDAGGGGGGGEDYAASTIASLPGSSLEVTPPPPMYLVHLVRLLREVSYYDANAAELTRCGAMPLLTKLLAGLPSFKHELAALTVETIWNCLDASLRRVRRGPPALTRAQLLDKHRKANAACALGKPACLVVLRNLLQSLLLHGYRQQDKELRNELVIVCTLIAARKSNAAAMLDAGFPTLLLQFGTAMELEAEPPCDPHTFATATELDVELKYLLWGMLATLAAGSDAALRAVTRCGRFMNALLAYMDADSAVVKGTSSLLSRYTGIATGVAGGAGGADGGRTALARLAGTQLHHLRRHALSILTSLAPRCVAIFLNSSGCAATLALLGEAEDEELEKAALKLLLGMAPFDRARDELGELGAIPLLLQLFTGDEHSLEVREDAVSILAALCEGHDDNCTRFRRADGVPALRSQLFYSEEDAAVREQLLVAVIDAVTAAVVGQRRSEARFVALEGVDALLDVVELVSLPMRRQLLACLAGLMRNRKAVPYFHDWRSDKSMRNGVQLLIAFYLEEETRLGVQQAAGGVLATTYRPLDGLKRPETAGSESGAAVAPAPAGTPPSPPASPAAAGGDAAAAEAGSSGDSAAPHRTVKALARLRKALKAARALEESRPTELERALAADDLRSKIFSVLCQLQMESEEVDVELHTWERIPLAAIHHFPSLRLSHAWVDVKEQLLREGVKPIDVDSRRLQREIDTLAAEAEQLRGQQAELWAGKSERKAAEEAEFFGKIRVRREQEFSTLVATRKKGGGAAVSALLKTSSVL